MATYEYNPNTGAKLKPGETVWDVANNRLITQGQQYGSGSAYTSAQNAAAQGSSASTTTAPSSATQTPSTAYTPAKTTTALTQEQVNNYKRLGIPIPAGTTIYGQSQPVSVAPQTASPAPQTAGTGILPSSTINTPQTANTGLSQSQLDNISKQIQSISQQTQNIASQVPQAIASDKPASGVSLPASNYDAILSSIQNTMGIGGQDDAKNQLANLIAQMQGYQKDYLTAVQSQQTPEQLYSQYAQSTGLEEKKQAMTSVQTKIQETNNLIDNLERNLTSRLQSADLNITEAQRLRQLQAEQKPYQEQLRTQTQQLATIAPEYQGAVDSLNQMLSLAQANQQQQLQAARAPMELSAQMLPYYQSLLEYQSPQEKLAQQIAAQIYTEQQMKAQGLGGYASSATEQWSEPFAYGNNYYQQNQATGELKSIGSIASGGGTDSDIWSEPFVLGGEYVQQNMKTGAVKSVASVGKQATSSDDLLKSMAGQLSNIDEVLGNSNVLSKISNKGAMSRLPLVWENMPTDEKEAIAKIEQVISQETLNSLIAAKDAGATFGALSNEELRMLADSATALSNVRMKNNRDQTLGYSASSDFVKQQLQKIKDYIIKAQGGTTTSGMTSIPFSNQSSSNLGFSSMYDNQTSSGTQYKIIQ